MKALTYTAARENLAQTMKTVCNDHSPVMITRKNNENVVMMSLEDYESLNETFYLMQSPANASLLLESIKELETGKGQDRELIE